MNERHTRTESGTDTASRITPEEAARELTADHNFDYQDSTAASTSSQHLPEAVMGEPYHLPECWKNLCETCDSDACPPCICTPLRACEQRVRIESQAWHWKQGYSAALDAAEARLLYAALGYSTDPEFHALAAIRALKEKP